MSKRKPATASKHAHSPRIAAKAQRAAQAIVRSPKASVPRSVGVDSNDPPPKRHEDAQQDALLVENPQLLIKNRETASQDDSKQMTENDSEKGIDFLSSANANVLAYQAKLLESKRYEVPRLGVVISGGGVRSGSASSIGVWPRRPLEYLRRRYGENPRSRGPFVALRAADGPDRRDSAAGWAEAGYD